ncbi:MAG: tetratricopeptide repeat protein [Candidatus Obscuribacterales bacterium]|nr:tetratricopeptide repeat protein [Candidatus Obscuribacterales bacterium]
MDKAQFYQRALAAIELRRWDVACRELTRALSESPNDARALSLLAACNFNMGEVNRAIEQSKLSIESDPVWTHAHYVLALCYTSVKKFKEAESAIQEALAIEPENPDFLMVFANLQFARMNWERGLALLEQGLATDPSHASCLRLTAYGLRQLGRLEDADEIVKKALALHPEDARLYAEAGWTAIRTDAAAAEEHFGEALRLNPEDKSFVRGMKEAQFQSKWFFRCFRYMFKPWICVPYYGLWILFSPHISTQAANLWLYGPILFLLVCSILNAFWEFLLDCYQKIRFHYLTDKKKDVVKQAGSSDAATEQATISSIFAPDPLGWKRTERSQLAPAPVQPKNAHPFIAWTLKNQTTLIAILVIASIVRLLLTLIKGN